MSAARRQGQFFWVAKGEMCGGICSGAMQVMPSAAIKLHLCLTSLLGVKWLPIAAADGQDSAGEWTEIMNLRPTG